MNRSVWIWQTDEYRFEVRVRDWREDKHDARTRIYTELGTCDPRTGELTESSLDRTIAEYRRLNKAGATTFLADLVTRMRAKDPVLGGTSVHLLPGTTARFSWKAGCSCGCSCGCVASSRVLFNGEVVDVWVTLKAGKPATWTQPALMK